MKKFYLLLLLFFVVMQSSNTNAQTVVINTGTAGTPEYSVGPVYMSPTLFYRASRFAYLYTASEMAAAGIPNGASITIVGWMKNNSASSLIAGNFRIYMKNSSAAAYSNATETWANLNAGTSLVYQSLNQLIPATASPSYIPFTLTAPFTYTGGSLEISCEWDATGSTGTLATGSFDWVWSTVVDRIYASGNTTMPTTLSSTFNNVSMDDRRPFIQITYTSTAVTCAAPTAPTATSITQTSASLNWTQAGTPINYQIKYGAPGFNVNTAGTSIFTPTKPYTLNPPLTAGTSYDYYVRAVCAAGDTSAWSPVTNFTTANICAVPTVPTATGITGTTASLNWTQTGTPINYQIKYGTPGFNVNTAGTSIFTPAKPYTLNPPLTPLTSYDYYVRAICAAGDTSGWSVVKNFTTTSNCSTPTVPTATSITATTASLDWTQTGTPGQWQIKYGAAGFNVNTAGTSIFTAAKPYTLNPPLSSLTSYDYYVRAVCSAGDTSAWSVVKNFTTLCNAPSVVSKKDSFNCGTGSVTLEATTTSGASIKWYPSLTGGTALATGNTYNTPTISATTTYYIAAVSGTCESTPRQAVVATIRPIPTVNIGHDTTICPGISYTLNAGNAGGTYIWAPGGQTTQTITTNAVGQYSVIVTVNKCVNKDTIIITPGTAPVNNLADSTNLCQGAITTLNAGNAGSTFIWTPGGATTQSITVNAGGTYAVDIRSIHGCKITSSSYVKMRPLPVNHLGNDTAICGSASVLMDAGNAGYNYLWNTGATSQTINSSDSGTYSVTVTSPYSCVNKDTIHIAYLPEPRTEGFNFILKFNEELGKVMFAPLNPTNVNSYEWNFGDNTPLVTAMNPTHVYAASGHYNVTLKVYNDCSDFSLSQVINVDLTTGIATVNGNNIDLVIYPNPAKSVLNISNQSLDYRMEDVMIFNAVGAMVYHQKADSKASHQLSVEHFTSGVYFVRILTDKGFVNQQVQILR